MKIKIIADRSFGEGELTKTLLAMEEMGFKLLQDNDILEYNGHSINMGVFDQLQSRDRRNPHTLALHKLIIETRVKKIEEADAVYVLNKDYANLIPQFFFEVSCAYSNHRPIFLYHSINSNDSQFDILNAMGVIITNGDLEIIKHYLELEIKTKSEELTAKAINGIVDRFIDKPKRHTLKLT